MTLGELALTPPVCQDVQGIPALGWVQHFRESPRAPYWVSIMGNTFWAMHHYCWALIHLHRAKQVGLPRNTRIHMVRTAISDYYYVVKNATPDFVLLPELHYRIGDAHMLIGEYAEAVAAFERSRAVRADYWPPYLGHATVLERLNKREEAREMVANALRFVPDEPRLIAAYKRLGGDPKQIGSRPKSTGNMSEAPAAAASSSQ